jgi:hypothetical protein
MKKRVKKKVLKKKAAKATKTSGKTNLILVNFKATARERGTMRANAKAAGFSSLSEFLRQRALARPSKKAPPLKKAA